MFRRAAVFLSLALCSCPRVSVDLMGRACTDGKCADGWVCRADENACTPEIRIGCDDPAAFCAWTSAAGDACSPSGAFLPCVDGMDDCRAGCRTCLESGTWSECSDPECHLGELWSCDRCDHDCRELVAHAEPACDANVAPSMCIYVGDCFGGWVDADRRRENGCECWPTGDETCNGVDDDCDGFVDDGATCAGTAICDGGTCVPCTDDDSEHCGATCAVCGEATICDGGACVPCTNDDPDHCGPTCAACAGATPSCVEGVCACVTGSCNGGEWCDSGSCRTCAEDDPYHCGAGCLICTGETDVCVAGSCQCSGASCGTGRWCDAGACRTCDTADHCGASCQACPPTAPVCDDTSGSCVCVGGSCSSGQFCDHGACTACACPTLFPDCLDQGDSTRVCRCSTDSCGTGGSCEDDDTLCLYADNFDEGTNLLHVCSDGIASSWAMREPTIGTCRSTPNCWTTNPDGNYNICELSCVESPTFDTSGVTGRIDVSFWAWYRLEADYDGVTPRFRDDSGWKIAPPTPGWDTAQVRLGDSCTWTDVTWPAFGQYNTADGIGWVQIRFGFDSATDAPFFHSDFAWRIYLETDGSVTLNGIWLDDVEVRITQAP